MHEFYGCFMKSLSLKKKKKRLAYSNCTLLLFTDIKSQNNFNLKKYMYFEMTISTFSLGIGWRELPIFLFPVFEALPAPPKGLPFLCKSELD